MWLVYINMLMCVCSQGYTQSQIMCVCVSRSRLTSSSRAVADGRTSNTTEDDVMRIMGTGRNDNSIKSAPFRSKWVHVLRRGAWLNSSGRLNYFTNESSRSAWPRGVDRDTKDHLFITDDLPVSYILNLSCLSGQCFRTALVLSWCCKRKVAKLATCYHQMQQKYDFFWKEARKTNKVCIFLWKVGLLQSHQCVRHLGTVNQKLFLYALTQYNMV